MPEPPLTPGVYIEEKNAFPNSVIAVATAVPVFIGYTQKAEYKGKSLLNTATRITSLQEYIELFGTGFKPKFKVIEAPADANDEIFVISGKKMTVQINAGNTLYFYSCIRLFYLNGGSTCYIMCVGTYGDKPDGIEIDSTDFTGNENRTSAFDILEKEYEPTLVVIPDVMAIGIDAYPVYQSALLHCQKTQNRFCIFDVWQSGLQTTNDDVAKFRGNEQYPGIGTTALNYGAAYYPWLRTTLVQSSEIDFTHLYASADLTALLPEDAAKTIAANMKTLTPAELTASAINIHQSLLAASTTYSTIIEAIKDKLNLLPPSAAMAGIFTLADNTRGVWKAPANVSVSCVTEPSINISAEEQEGMNIDAITGKSINVIRTFPGIGTLVWGARTLDGNSQDWRFINVRRTVIMIEQSIKPALRAYLFEPNDYDTWVTIKSMLNNFLNNLWKQGALAGSTPEQAFDVAAGLGTTMTPTDILEGYLRVTVKIAITRPAEFIVLTFQQQMQTS